MTWSGIHTLHTWTIRKTSFTLIELDYCTYTNYFLVPNSNVRGKVFSVYYSMYTIQKRRKRCTPREQKIRKRKNFFFAQLQKEKRRENYALHSVMQRRIVHMQSTDDFIVQYS